MSEESITSSSSAGTSVEQMLLMAADDRQKLAVIRDALAGLHRADPERTIVLASEGYRLATTLRDTTAMSDVLRCRGLAHLVMLHPEAALTDLREAYDLLGDDDHLRERAALALETAKAYAELGHAGRALDWLAAAHRIASSGEIPAIVAEASEAAGDIQAALGNYSGALERYLESLAARERLGELDGVGRVLSSIGILHGHTGDYAAAHEYFTRSMAAFRQAGNRYHEVGALTNLGTIHYTLGEYDLALEHMLTALTIYEALEDRTSVGRVMVTIGSIYEARGELEAAVEFQLRAFRLLDGTGDDELQVTVLLGIGRIRMQLDAGDEALFVFDQARHIAEGIGDRRLRYRVHEAMSQVYEGLGQLVPALEHHKLYASLKDEVAGEEKQKAIAELQVRSDLERAEQQVEIYRLRAQQLELENRRKQNELAAMALNLLQKKELLESLQGRLGRIEDDSRGSVRAVVQTVMTEIDVSKNAEDDWKRFEQQLDHLHQDFVRTLADRCPALTPTEIKICSLTRIGLQTKEIANLLYLSVRTVHAHKYNLRKKLGLSQETSLPTFLAAL